MRREGVKGLALVAAFVVSMSAAPAFAAKPTIVVDNNNVSLTPAKGGDWVASVPVSNPTDTAIVVTAQPASASCDVTVGGRPSLRLAPSRVTHIAVKVPQACDAKGTFPFSITPAHGPPIPIRASVKADPPDPSPDWTALIAFPIALFVALVLTLVVLLASGTGPFEPLAGLVAPWSFKDSFATNLTAASGIVALVLGASDVLKAIIGPDPEAALAVATVAGAIAIALVGAAGVIVLAVPASAGSTEISVGGLLLGAGVALGAAGGQVAAVAALIIHLDLTAVLTWITWVATIIALLLLALYAVTSLWSFIKIGTTPARDVLAPPPSPQVVAAAIIAASVKQGELDYNEITGILTRLQPDDAAAPAVVQAARPLSGRSALL